MGTIQYQLDPAVLAQLKAILRQCPSFNTLMVEVRQAVLQSCAVDCFFDHSPGFYQLKVDFFVTVLCATLLKNDVNNNPALAHFLEYIVYEEIPSADLEFVVQIMEGLKQQQPSTLPNTITTRRNRLREARQQATQAAQNQPSQMQVQATGQISKHDLVAYDLGPIVGQFVATIKSYGIHHYTTSGEDRAILQNYIIERLTVELKRTTGRPYRSPYHLWLDELTSSVLPLTAIEQAFLNEENIALEQLFREKTKQDIILVIWNARIPETTLTTAITTFTTRLTKIAIPHFKERCLLIIWANVGVDKAPLPHHALTILPPLKRFDQDDLQVWFKRQLSEIGLDLAKTEHYLNQVSTKRGRLIPTYNTLQKIIRTINNNSQGATA